MDNNYNDGYSTYSSEVSEDAFEGDPVLAKYQTPEKQQYWEREIESSRQERKNFINDGNKVIERYASRTTSSAASDLGRSSQSDYNIFFANTDIKLSALYARTPQPDIKRRFNDADDDVNHAWFSGASTTAGNTVSLNTSMLLDINGNLGVGMTPSAWRGGAKAIQFGTFGGLNVMQNGTLALTFAAYESGSNTFSYTTSGDTPARYRQITGAHYWDTSTAGTTGGAVTFTQSMALDANGNLGLGVTPSAWGSSFRAIEMASGAIFSNTGGTSLYSVQNGYFDGANWRYKIAAACSSYNASSGTHSWNVAPSGTAGSTINFNTALTIDNSSQLLAQTTTARYAILNTTGTNAAIQFNANSTPVGYMGTAGAMFTGGVSSDIGISSGGNIQFGAAGGSISFTISNAGVVTYGGVEVGYKDVPRQTGGLVRGTCWALTAGFTLATGLAVGSCYTLYNDSGSAVTITQGSGVTLRLTGTTTTGNRTIAARGMATVWVNTTTEYLMSGPGVS